MSKYMAPRKRRTHKKKAKSTRSIANKALKLAQGEMFYLDTQSASAGDTVSSSGTITLVTGIAEGNGQSQREGLWVNARTFELRSDMWGNGLDIFNGTTLRVLLVVDTENTGTTPTVADILEVTGTSFAVVSPYKKTTLPRYRVLMDKMYSLGAENSLTATTYVPERTHLVKKFRFNQKLAFKGTGATDVFKNAAYLIYISDSLTNDPQVTWYARLGYNN